jgi:hypothetical protein
MILKYGGWVNKVIVDYRPPSGKAPEVGIREIPPRGKKEGEAGAPEFSQIAPCINGCIGGPPTGYTPGSLQPSDEFNDC